MSNWISLKDELPPKDVGLLITDGKVVTVASFTGTFKTWDALDRLTWDSWQYGGYEWEFDFDERNITHWMPLPDPPNS